MNKQLPQLNDDNLEDRVLDSSQRLIGAQSKQTITNLLDRDAA